MLFTPVNSGTSTLTVVLSFKYKNYNHVCGLDLSTGFISSSTVPNYLIKNINGITTTNNNVTLNFENLNDVSSLTTPVNNLVSGQIMQYSTTTNNWVPVLNTNLIPLERGQVLKSNTTHTSFSNSFNMLSQMDDVGFTLSSNPPTNSLQLNDTLTAKINTGSYYTYGVWWNTSLAITNDNSPTVSPLTIEQSASRVISSVAN